MNDINRFNAVLRNDLASFIRKVFTSINPGSEYLHNWHIEALAYHLDAALRGEITRLIITVPPRSLKSVSASVALPAFALGRNPSRRIVCASYSQDLALRHARDTQRVMESAWYRRLFPATRVDQRRAAAQEFTTTQNGYRFTTSVGGSLTGRGGDLIIIDDAHKADEAQSDTRRTAVIDWYRNTVVTRLDNKKADTIIVIQQRLHEEDLVGYLLEAGDNWVHLDLPAIAEDEYDIPIGRGRYHHRNIGDVLHSEREPKEVLDALKAELGSYAFAAQYQQRPAPAGGELIKWGWFRWYNKLPPQRPTDQIVQSWDVAATAESYSDWSVCTTWYYTKSGLYLMDVQRYQVEIPVLMRLIVSEADRLCADVILLETTGIGLSIHQTLGNRLPLVPIKPEYDKATRMYQETPAIEAGRVFLPENQPWLADFQHELVHFPKGKHDDQVDSLSQFLWWARRKEQHRPPQYRLTIIEAEPRLRW